MARDAAGHREHARRFKNGDIEDVLIVLGYSAHGARRAFTANC